MKLSPQEVALVRSTFRLLEPKSGVAALSFYQRILARNPALRLRLEGNIDVEAERLMSLLRLAAELADRPEALRAHLGGGGSSLRPAWNDPDTSVAVDEALLWSLGATLGGDFSPEARAAWAPLVKAVTNPRTA